MRPEHSRPVLVFGLVLALFLPFEQADAAAHRREGTHQYRRSPLVRSAVPAVSDGGRDVSEPETHDLALALLANEEVDPGVLVVWVDEHAAPRRADGESERIVESVLKTDDPLLLLALFRLESRLNPSARSPEGALGLGQIVRGHVPRLKARGIIRSEEDLLRIEENVRAAHYVWKTHLEGAGGDRRRALSEFGGFRTRSASLYLRKVYAGVGELATRVIRSRKDRFLLAEASGEKETAGER